MVPSCEPASHEAATYQEEALVEAIDAHASEHNLASIGEEKLPGKFLDKLACTVRIQLSLRLGRGGSVERFVVNASKCYQSFRSLLSPA